MFRSQGQPCYPEPGQPEGCFPAHARTPAPFQCWLAGVPDRLSPPDRTSAAAQHPARSAQARSAQARAAQARRRSKPGR